MIVAALAPPLAETRPTLAEAAHIALAGGAAALVTVLATEGSAPRGAGARMLVTARDLFGTIGGGRLEWRAAEQARRLLALSPGAWRVQDYPLGPLLGQCCGGRVRLLVERLDDAAWLAAIEQGRRVLTRLTPSGISRHPGAGLGRPTGVGAPAPSDASLLQDDERCRARGPLPRAGDTFPEPHDVPQARVYLFGAGHVGRAIARALAPLPFQLAWFDGRAELADLPGLTITPEPDLPARAAAAPAEAAVLVLTHDHALDYALTTAALGGAARFVGLIGSATKRARFVARLHAEGIDAARLVCPIGLAGVAGKEPAVIAVAVAAQLLGLRPPTGAAP